MLNENWTFGTYQIWRICTNKCVMSKYCSRTAFYTPGDSTRFVAMVWWWRDYVIATFIRLLVISLLTLVSVFVESDEFESSIFVGVFSKYR